MKKPGHPKAAATLRGILAGQQKDPKVVAMIEAQAEVLAKFQPIFALDNLDALSEAEFLSFLSFKENKHWTGLSRSCAKATANMPKLRSALRVLLDESKPIDERLNDLVPLNGEEKVKGLGRGVLTAILFIAHPDMYGVWNGTSKAAMQVLDVWPEFAHGMSFGKKYLQVNSVLLELRDALGTDLWTIDLLWWLVRDEEPGDESPLPPADEGESMCFGLEKYLHEFLRDNWEKTQLGTEWNLYEEDGEVVGYKYKCDVGEIDLLAKHSSKKKPRWLVIELKRKQTSDDTLGQVLRYMGWVEEHLAGGDPVEGLIIASEFDEKLRYALKVTRGIAAMTYRVDFHLQSSDAKSKTVKK